MFKAIKHIAFIPLVISCYFCHGQGVRFQFYRTKACSTVEQLDSAYSLYKMSGNLDTEYSPKAGTVYLPGTGRYGIAITGPMLDTIFNIRDTGLFVFRFKEPGYGLYNTNALDTPPLYSRCDSLLNGYQEYHYPNGSLEMRGTFKHGYPTDSIITFYRNGQTKRRTITYPKVIIFSSFDSLGHKTQITYSQNKSVMEYGEYHTEKFYLNGKVKRKESSIKRIKTIKEFYPDGRLKIVQTKHHRIEYYDNGLKRITYTRTYKRNAIMHSIDFTIYKTEYDSSGQISRKSIYESRNYNIAQPLFALKQSSFIISVDCYAAGNKVSSVEGMDTNEFLKKYPDEFDDNEEEDH